MTPSVTPRLNATGYTAMESLPSHLDPNQYSSLKDLYAHITLDRGKLGAYSSLGKTLSYQEWDRLSEHFAAYLHHETSLVPGDRIAIQLPNLLHFPIALLGAIKAGLVVVSTNPLYTANEMGHQFRDSGAKAVIILSSFCDKLESVISETGISSVIVAELGDLQPPLRRAFINFSAKYFKSAVPNYRLANAASFKECCNYNTNSLPAQLETGTGDDLAAIFYTGGTTGYSKGAMLSHNNLIANMMQLWSRCGLVIGEAVEKVAAPLPLYHSYAFLLHCLAMPFAGNLSVLIPNPRDLDSVVSTFVKHEISCFVGINTLYLALLEHPKFRSLDFSHLRFCGAGGMALSTSIARRWEHLTGCQIFEGYGLTECSPVVAINLPGRVRMGTVGELVPETEIMVVDDSGKAVKNVRRGEAYIRGPQVMLGYWQQEEATRDAISEDGWFKTGDYVETSEDGYITIVDRKKDMILVSGFNVFPNEIEDWVNQHPAVLESAAIGIPDERRGERVKLFVVRKSESLSSEQIKEYCSEGLTAYKVPNEIVFVKDLPKSLIGKILRKELK